MADAMSAPSHAVTETLALAGTLPVAAVVAVFARYGKPLAIALPDDGERRALDGDVTLRHLALRTPVDVIANDWFVLVRKNDEPLAMAGPLVAAALAALARASRR
jgi:hypothetical protein